MGTKNTPVARCMPEVYNILVGDIAPDPSGTVSIKSVPVGAGAVFIVNQNVYLIGQKYYQ